MDVDDPPGSFAAHPTHQNGRRKDQTDLEGSDDLKMAWESVWRLRGAWAGAWEAKKNSFGVTRDRTKDLKIPKKASIWNFSSVLRSPN